MNLLSILMFLFLISGCWDSDTKQTPTGEVEIIDGHTLPPDPGEAGKETLLGIDSNDDGVRDDVERYIYHRFSKEEYPKTKIAIAMQFGRAVQKILVNPQHAYENKTYIYLENASDCQEYFIGKITKNDTFEVYMNFSNKHTVFDEYFEDFVFNTKDRLEAYIAFNASLSGHTFSDSRQTIADCEVNINDIVE